MHHSKASVLSAIPCSKRKPHLIAGAVDLTQLHTGGAAPSTYLAQVVLFLFLSLSVLLARGGPGR